MRVTPDSARSWFSVDCAFGFVVLRGLQPAELWGLVSICPPSVDCDGSERFYIVLKP